MAIYGNTISFGGGGSNDTLPPLLDNFKATRLEASLVPPVSNSVAFKDIPDGSKIKLVKGSNISATVTYGTTNDLNHRIVFDSNDWTKKEFKLENDSSHNNISGSDIDQWLNATKASGWWTTASRPYAGEIDPPLPTTNTTRPDYANDEGFLYQLGMNDELLMQNFNDININATAKAKVGLPWLNTHSEEFPYTFFKNISVETMGEYVYVYGSDGDLAQPYNKLLTRASDRFSLTNISAKIHPMMEPKPDTKVALDVDGSYFMFENQAGGIILSADKMEESRATDLAGAVWVYGDHIPQNKNDGTKIELAREEIVLPEEGDTDIPPISYTELERPTSTKTWTATEDGYYKFVGVAEAGRSGTARRIAGASYNVSGGSGGSGGIVASVFKLKRGESVSLAIASGDVTISYGSETANATHGQDGGSSSSEPDNKVKPGIHGKPGTATGGNLANINGEPGSPGKMLEGNKATIVRGGETVYEKHISRGGYARTTMRESEVVSPDKGTDAYVVILKGDEEKEDPSFRVVDRTIEWDTSKDFYARQFTYNARKHYQTSMAGAIAFLSRPTLRIGDLPSKSVIRLGRGKEFTGGELLDFTWHTTKDKVGNQYLVLMGLYEPRFAAQYGSAANNVGAARRFDYSVLCQWVNADKASGEWFVPNQYNESIPASYNNMDGFLHYWTEKEKGVLQERSWKLDEGEKTTITNYFFGKVFVPTQKNVAVAAVNESAESDDNLDIFTSDSDRVFHPGRQWWTSTPESWSGSTELIFCVGSDGGYSSQRATGTAYVRPIVSISPDTPVYEQPNEDGSYNICFTSPDDFENTSSKVYVYSDTAPTNKSLMWIQKGSNVLYVHNGTNWMPITGVYGGGN